MRFAFVPGSRPDDVLGFWQVEAEGPPGCLRVVTFDPGDGGPGTFLTGSGYRR